MVALPSSKKTYIDPRELPEVERATLGRIFSYLRPYRWYAILVLLSITCAALLGALPPLFIKRIVDHAIPERNMRMVLLLSGGMVVGPLLGGLLGVAQKYLSAYIAERVMFDLRVQLFRHVQRQSLGYFATAKPGEVVSRVLNDVQGVGKMMEDNLVKLLQNAIVLATTTAIIFTLDWRLALVAFGLLPAFIVPTRRVGRTRKALKRRAQARMAEMTGILMETLSVSGALLLKVFGTEKLETRRLKAKAGELMALSLRHNLVGRWFNMLMKLFEDLGPALVYGFGGYLIIQGEMPLGTVIAFVALQRKLYSPASDLAGVHVDVVTSYAYFDRIFAVLDLEPAIRNDPDAIRLDETNGAITFDHVSFSYGSDDKTLQNIHIDIAPGECIAIVGPSGAGKTTLAALIPRLYDPTEGALLVDGHDVRKIKLKSLRSHIGIVTQETYLFHASILENLRYARPDATPEEVEEAARAAQIHDFIAALPDSYATIVGERGYRLSGGERQRLAIARAILKDPKILILDEATSSLDSSNETLIQAALEPLLSGRTSLVIAHRLSTIRKADRIIVLERGHVVELGTHDELLATGRLYAKLHREQFGYQEPQHVALTT
jgi:ATP-binding cassette subfamily B protein